MDWQRSGPDPLPDDSWDSASTGLQRHIRRSPRRYRWLVLIAVVAALIPAVLIPVLSSDDQPDPTFGAEPSSSSRVPSSTVSTATATPTAVAVAVTASPRPPAPGALIIEAEAPGVQLRRAEAVTVEGASGGRAVRFTDRRGQVAFLSLVLPATAQYRVTIVYAPGGSWSGSARGGSDSQQIAFVEGSACCRTVTVTLRLSAGGSLRIEPSHGDGPLPAIDRVIIERA